MQPILFREQLSILMILAFLRLVWQVWRLVQEV